MKKREILKIIMRFTNAKEADSWKGGGDPADWPAIRKELREARKALMAMIDKIGKPD